jgi:hypothetical protein
MMRAYLLAAAATLAAAENHVGATAADKASLKATADGNLMVTVPKGKDIVYQLGDETTSQATVSRKLRAVEEEANATIDGVTQLAEAIASQGEACTAVSGVNVYIAKPTVALSDGSTGAFTAAGDAAQTIAFVGTGFEGMYDATAGESGLFEATITTSDREFKAPCTVEADPAGFTASKTSAGTSIYAVMCTIPTGGVGKAGVASAKLYQIGPDGNKRAINFAGAKGADAITFVGPTVDEAGVNIYDGEDRPGMFFLGASFGMGSATYECKYMIDGDDIAKGAAKAVEGSTTALECDAAPKALVDNYRGDEIPLTVRLVDSDGAAVTDGTDVEVDYSFYKCFNNAQDFDEVGKDCGVASCGAACPEGGASQEKDEICDADRDCKPPTGQKAFCVAGKCLHQLSCADHNKEGIQTVVLPGSGAGKHYCKSDGSSLGGDGLSKEFAGKSCATIRRRFEAVESKAYWVYSNDAKNPYQVFCDMLSCGNDAQEVVNWGDMKIGNGFKLCGGWTLVMNVGGIDYQDGSSTHMSNYKGCSQGSNDKLKGCYTFNRDSKYFRDPEVFGDTTKVTPGRNAQGPAYTRQKFTDIMFRQTFDRVVNQPWYRKHPQHNDRPWPSFAFRFDRTYSQFNEQIRKCREQMDGYLLMKHSSGSRHRNKNEVSRNDGKNAAQYLGWANRRTSWHYGADNFKIGWFGHDGGGCANSRTIAGCGGYSRGHSMNTVGWGNQHHHGNSPGQGHRMGSWGLGAGYCDMGDGHNRGHHYYSSRKARRDDRYGTGSNSFTGHWWGDGSGPCEATSQGIFVRDKADLQ